MSHENDKLKFGVPADAIVMACPVDVNPDDDSVRYYGGLLVCESASTEWRRRIVACVNACVGMDTELLEIIVENDKTLSGVIAHAETQRDDTYQRESAMAETIAAIAGLCTYRHETKEEFIGRVRAVLGEDPDIRVSRIRQQRDELLAALEQFLDPEGNPPEDNGEWREVLRAIASVKSYGKPEKTAETEGGAS
jgi:hypothetical protein